MLETEVDSFFAEQDRRMNISDDEIDEYVGRMNAESQRQRQNKTASLISGPSKRKETSMDVEVDQNAHDAGTLMNSIEVATSPNPSIPKRKRYTSQTPMRPRKRSRSSDEGLASADDSFRNKLMTPSFSRGPGEPASPKHEQSAPLRRSMKTRRVTPTSSPQPSNSSSRSRTAASKNKGKSVTESPEAKKPRKRNARATEAKLDRSSSPPYRDTSPASQRDTSPIEDANEFPEKPARAVTETRSMLEEVNERIAQHSANKRRNKVMKLAKSRKASSGSAIETSSVTHVPSSPPTGAPASTPAVVRSYSTWELANPGKTRKKLNPGQLYPDEYVDMLRAEASKPTGRKKTKEKLVGAKIYYCGGDWDAVTKVSKAKMQRIIELGGTLVPIFDPDVVTHIVVDPNLKSKPASLLKALGMKSLDNIPDHIPTLLFSWVNDPKPFEVQLWRYASFASRFDAGSKEAVEKAKQKKAQAEAEAESGEVSRIEDFTNDDIQPPTGGQAAAGSKGESSRSIKLKASTSRIPLNFQPEPKYKAEDPNDPLAEFYEQARAEQHEEIGRYGEAEETDDETDASSSEDEGPPAKKQKAGWTCDNKEASKGRGACANQTIVDKLQELLELHRAKPGDEERWRVYSYTKAIRALRSYPKRIKSLKDAKAIDGVGEKTALKIMEIIKTGDLQRLKYERTDMVEVSKLFQGIYGVGQSTAVKWYQNGCRTLDDLRKGKGGVRLSKAQKIGLQYYDDINDRMPREEASAIFALIKPIALSIDPALYIEIMGSYRRGKADCGDIDILITRPIHDGKTHEGVLSRLLARLRAENILTEDLALPEHDPEEGDLEAIYRGLCCLPEKEGARRRRIDFLTVPWKSKGAALLYYTGDDIFNRSMRLKANKMGYSLNQRGLYQGVVRDVRNRTIKTNKGTLLASETEEDIFRILQVPWQEPHERIRPSS
ncbi:dna polymerase lambda [Moniliophthora roreri MCA 2997]|uniref:DNA-directed DNA polymerase n=1 Tax=Moniliophthora roreri (strain MCA 2997) TaxID=1381753 RepID=V2YCS0_MONRO|nr:dna polymerase lambda [Moniliophthora roreri MCA 2997]